MKRSILLATLVVTVILISVALAFSLRPVSTTTESSKSTTLGGVTTFVSGDQTTGVSPSNQTTTIVSGTNSLPVNYSQPRNFIVIDSMTLCSTNCGLNPSPFLSGTVFVNSTIPLRTLQLSINGTFESSQNYSNNFTNYAIAYKLSPINQSMPIISGKTYFVVLVATFLDTSQSIGSIVIKAN
jgi:hypothetical protein